MSIIFDKLYLEKNELVTHGAKFAETLITFLSNIIKTLNVEKNEYITHNTCNENVFILTAIKIIECIQAS